MSNSMGTGSNSTKEINSRKFMATLWWKLKKKLQIWKKFPILGDLQKSDVDSTGDVDRQEDVEVPFGATWSQVALVAATRQGPQ